MSAAAGNGSAAGEALERALAGARSAGADSADAMLLDADSIETRVRGSEVERVVQAREHTLGLRALLRDASGVRSAVTSTSDLSPEAVDRMARETVALARAIAPDPAAGLPEGPFADDLPDLKLCAPEDRAVSVEARIDDARAAENAARALDPRISNSEGSEASSSFTRVHLGNSQGFRGEYEAGSHALWCAPLAVAGDSMQRDSWHTVGRSLAGLEAPPRVGRRAAERALSRLGARRVPTCEVPVIFDPVTAPSLLRHLAACVSGYSVYRGASFLGGCMGQAVASQQITVLDDGRLPGGLGSAPFDGEGLPTRRNTLVEHGRLCSWLLDTYSARKLGLTSTGNAARGPASLPTAASSNLWIEPGAAAPEQIIADTRRGLLVTALMGMGFNPVTGDYSRGAAGVWIENGEPVHPVEEVTIAGNLGDMLLGIDAVGSDLMWLSSTAAPTLRVARMTVAGA